MANGVMLFAIFLFPDDNFLIGKRRLQEGDNVVTADI